MALLRATMLYRAGIMEKIHGVAVDWTVVDEHEVEAMLSDGWYRSPDDVKAQKAAKQTEAAQVSASKK